MPEITIKYKNPKTLQALRDFAKYFDFIISSSKQENSKKEEINGVSLIPSDKSIDASELESIFSNKNMNAQLLRTKAWQRNK